jgi:hypothetical protein
MRPVAPFSRSVGASGCAGRVKGAGGRLRVSAPLFQI